MMNKRRKNDAYYTPSWAVDELLNHVSISCTVLEPCSGDGAISNRLIEHGLSVDTNDINPSVDASTHLDYLSSAFSKRDWIVTNPPFSDAFEFLKLSLNGSYVGVAMLLRLSFLEPTYDRGEFLSKVPPNYVIVLPRISFTGDGKTDSVTTAWMVWVHGMKEQRVIIVPKNIILNLE